MKKLTWIFLLFHCSNQFHETKYLLHKPFSCADCVDDCVVLHIKYFSAIIAAYICRRKNILKTHTFFLFTCERREYYTVLALQMVHLIIFTKLSNQNKILVIANFNELWKYYLYTIKVILCFHKQVLIAFTTGVREHSERRDMFRPFKVSSDVHTGWIHGRGIYIYFFCWKLPIRLAKISFTQNMVGKSEKWYKCRYFSRVQKDITETLPWVSLGSFAMHFSNDEFLDSGTFFPE